MPNGQIKGNCLIWDIDHDLVVWDVKPELRAWQGQIYLSVLNELHGSPANLDVQTASNLDLAKVRDHKLIQYLCQQYACDVFDLMQDDERVKEEIGFYNPAAWVDEDGNPVINANRWKLWQMYSAGLPAMQFRNCREAFYRTQMESPENNNPDRFRIRFREPQDLMTVKSEELAGAAVRRYLFPEPFVFDKQGYPHWDRSTLPDVNSVYLGGFDGEFISLRNPNASHKESGKLRGRRLQRFADIDRGAVMFVHLGFAASPEGRDHRGKKVTSEQDAGIAAYLYAEEDVHNRIKASGMYLDIYAELVKLVFDRGLTLEPPRNPDGTVKPIADGILGGPHTLDGLLDIARAAGVTRSHVPLSWESARVRQDYGDLNLDIVVEDTLVRMAGTTANWIGIVDLPDGQYRMEHGLVVSEDTREALPQEPAVALVAVNGFEQRLKDQRLEQEDRQRIEAELKAFRAQVCDGVTIKPVTYRNPETEEDEAGAEVFLEGAFEPLGWISQEHLAAVTGELKGVLVSGGQYSLKVLCPLPEQGTRN